MMRDVAMCDMKTAEQNRGGTEIAAAQRFQAVVSGKELGASLSRFNAQAL